MGTTTGLGHFQGRGNTSKPSSLSVRKCIEHCGAAVKVRCDPPAGILFRQGIEANVLLSAQMVGND